MKNNTEELSGKTITFYSYKGGVGRTMALVNTACLMAKQGKRVLLIDWDLEAPGIHTFIGSPKKNEEIGLVDLITDLNIFLKEEKNNNDNRYIDFFEENIHRFISKKYVDKNKTLQLDIIKAGKFDKSYTTRLNAIDWIELYRRSPSVFRTMAQFLETKYDYILIDSRTGLSDTSGVCTLLMPQILVLVFALNNQNLNGVLDVAKQSVDYRFDSNDYRNLTVLPLPSRIDDENPIELSKWIKNYKGKFESLFEELYYLDKCDLKNYFDHAKIPYKPIYAYGENLPVLHEEINNDFFISYHYSHFLKIVDNSIPIWDILRPDQIEKNRKESVVHLKNGIDYYEEKNYKKACDEFEKSCDLYSTNDLVFYHWGITLAELAKLAQDLSLYEESIDKFQTASKLNEKNDLAVYEEGRSTFNIAKIKNDNLFLIQSLILFQHSLKINPERKHLFYDFETEARVNSIPKEIREKGVVTMSIYLDELEQRGATLNQARIIILGDKGVGKTSIARRLIDPNTPMTTEEKSTAGVDTILWQPENEQINIRIWDFSGQIVTNAIHQFFLSEQCLYLVVYNGRKEENNRLEYWLNIMENYGGDSQAIILVNERDQHRADTKINFLKEKYSIAGVYFFSVKNDADKLATFREDIIQYIVNNPSWENQSIPISYYQVKEELETVFSKDEQHKAKEHITRKAFDKIADKYKVENKEHLLQSLHCLGVSLWYKEMAEFNTLVLNPEWISHGVYKILNWVHESKNYSLTIEDFTAVFAEDAGRYPIKQYLFLFKLMKHYEMAYETEEGGNLVIPHLLREDRPEILPEFCEDDLKLKYEANQSLPPNTLSLFIVRHNQQIKIQQQESLVWRYGVILENSKGSLALVREEDRIISISVTGQDKSNYIAELRASLNDIFNSYKGDKPELQYKVISDVDISVGVNTENSELWLPEQRVLNLFNAGVPHFEDASGKNITMNLTIHNYHMQDNSRVLQAEHIDNSINNTFNFYDCNIRLQGDLNHLAQLLTETGKKEEAKAMENTANALEQLEQCKSKDEVKKKGLASRMQQLAEDLDDKKSKLRKAVDGVEKGVKISQDIAKRYNSIAEWLGLPQVPKPLL